MAFHSELSIKAIEKLESYDEVTRGLIVSWLKKNLDDCLNPRAIGTPMKKFEYNQWKYRIGSYRLLALINSNSVIILDIISDH